jgi:hypothetical protein
MRASPLNSCASPGTDAVEEISNCPICMDTPEDRGVLDCVSALAIMMTFSSVTDFNQAMLAISFRPALRETHLRGHLQLPRRILSATIA